MLDNTNNHTAITGTPERPRVDVLASDRPLQLWHPLHGWGAVRALCPEFRGMHALVLVEWHDCPSRNGWLTLDGETLSRVEWRPVAVLLALYGRADVLTRSRAI